MAAKAGVVIAIDKPLQWTSFQVVNRLKWHIRRTFGLKKFKIGHAGTLDPLATGLLLVCVGSATKRIEELQSGIKEYSGTMVLGATTPCFDLEQAIDHYYPTEQITPESIESARPLFIGDIEQVPPMFSAVKVDGQRAYVSARDGSPMEIAPKKITIYDFELGSLIPSIPTPSVPSPSVQSPSTVPTPSRELYRNPQGSVPEGLLQVDFHVTCSKGTYIRSLARDFGIALDSGAFLSSLRRQRIGEYTLDDAITIDDIESLIVPTNPIFQAIGEW